MKLDLPSSRGIVEVGSDQSGFWTKFLLIAYRQIFISGPCTFPCIYIIPISSVNVSSSGCWILFSHYQRQRLVLIVALSSRK
ncbi:hypothetical protein K1719_017090 [Acacia pycnantha]|nr:hypothetical protein K1719_017090 [Acacia pycnantha]